jgi:hypothetical protein
MFAHTKDTLDAAESAARDGSIDETLKVLRKLPLSDFGELMWTLPTENYPNLSARLPKMADVKMGGPARTVFLSLFIR